MLRRKLNAGVLGFDVLSESLIEVMQADVVPGVRPDEVLAKQAQGYRPESYCENNEVIARAINKMYTGINGCQFDEVANSLKFKDPYMVLADFDAYQSAQQYISECYKDKDKWNKMSLHNIAGAGIFSADRAVEDYARDIWKLK